jgi:hypothetical protein
VFFSLKSILQDFKKLFAFFGVIKGLIKTQLAPDVAGNQFIVLR